MTSRAATEADAIAGVVPRDVFEPASVDALAEALRAAHARRLSLAIVGGRTQLELGAPPSRLDAVVSTRRLARVVDHAAADQVVVVEAGVTLMALQAVLAKERQRLAFDPPLGDRRTIGGLIATNDFGPLRARYGSLKDLIIGVSFVRADGRVARGGGRVVKNVAGFDMPKLMVGSLGTLGAIATATFRVHPLPEAIATLRFPALAPAALRALVVRVRDEQLEPTALAAVGSTPHDLDLLVRFEGFAAGVDEQSRAAVAIARHSGVAVDVVSAGDALRLWADHDARRARGAVRWKIAAAPASLPGLLTDVVPPLAGALSGASIVVYPTVGVAFVSGDVSAADAATLAPLVERARASIEPRGGSLVLHAVPAAMRGAVDAWTGAGGATTTAAALMRRTKARFDPHHRLNPGRFVYGI